MNPMLEPIGRVVEGWPNRAGAPKQGRESDRTGLIEIEEAYLAGLEGLAAGDWLWLLLWFDRAGRDRLRVHPRGDESRPLTGVFNTRSPSRPNPIAMDLVRLKAIDGRRLEVEGLDALTGTPVLDIKPHVPRLDSGRAAEGKS